VPLDAGVPIVETDGGIAELPPEEEEWVPPPLEGIGAEVLEALCVPAAEAICAARARCGCGPEEWGQPPPVRDECIRSVEASCEDLVRCSYDLGEADGLAIDPASLRTCLDGIRADASACTAPAGSEACQSLVVEDVRAGQPCGEEAERCRGGECTDGRCVPLPRLGQRCEWSCAPGATCVEEVCVPERVRLGGRCDDGRACAAGLACDGERCRRAPRTNGRECWAWDDCGEGSTCFVDDEGETEEGDAPAGSCRPTLCDPIVLGCSE
jgi:hypothetical protein